MESSEPVELGFQGPTCAEGCCDIVNFFVTRFAEIAEISSAGPGGCEGYDAPDLCKIFPSDLPWNLSSVAIIVFQYVNQNGN